jgi:serine/threonine-protein kinase
MQAIDHFEAAIRADPAYALAYSGLAACYSTLAFTSGYPPRAVFQRARLALRRAIELDDTLSEAHESLAGVKFWHEWDWDGAEREFRRAIELDPYQAAARRFFAHYQAGDYDGALAQLQRALQMDPEYWMTRLNLGRVYERQGRYDEALRELRAACDLSKESGETKALLGYTLAASGRTAEASQIVEELRRTEASGCVHGYGLALAAAGAGDRDQMYVHLHSALRDRDVGFTFLRVERRWRPHADDPRFQDVLERVGFVRETRPEATG